MAKRKGSGPSGNSKFGGPAKQSITNFKAKMPTRNEKVPTKKVEGEKLNPFERLWNRRKFDVLGKKTKGEQRKIGQSRSRAVEVRKDTLLHEFRQSKKANAFVDRRFGEADESLADEDKAIMRYQKERLSQLNKSSRFNLRDSDEEEEELLTHRGMAMGADDFDEEDVMREDPDDELDAEIVDKLHFGGLQPKQGGRAEDDAEADKPKSRKEVMEELIAKSKFYKAQKAKEKDENDELLGTLDEQFKELTQQKLLNAKPTKKDEMAALMAKYGVASEKKQSKGSKKEKGTSKKENGKVKEEEKDDYEQLAKEMVFEMRARASDRTKDPEEVAKEERERLEKLEKKRKQRMEGADDASDGEDSDDEKGSRRAQKRRKRAEASGDDLGENFVLEGEEYQQEGWATDLMKQDQEKSDEDEGSDDEAEESDEEDDDVSEGGSEDGADVSEDDADASGDGDNVSDEEEGASDLEEDLDGFLDAVRLEKEKRAAAGRKEEAPMKEKHVAKEVVVQNGKKGGQDTAEKELASRKGEKMGTLKEKNAGVQKAGKEEKKGKKAGKKQAKKAELPFVIDAPQTLELFRAIVDGRSDAELALAIERIRACNSVKLAAENRRKMQIFYSVLVQYFSALAGEVPLPLQRIDVLVRPLLEMSQDTPLIAALNARERILKMQQQLSVRLREHDGGTCWPSNRTVLLLRLWTLTFPPSDFRHPVMTPVALLVGEYLARCPVFSFRDAAVGAFLASLALQMHSQAQRFCPEALNFLHALLLTSLSPAKLSKHRLLWTALPAYLSAQIGSQQWLDTTPQQPVQSKDSLGKGRNGKKVKKAAVNGNSAPEDHTETASMAPELAPLDLVFLLSSEPGSRDIETVRNKQSLLAAAVETLRGFVRLYKDFLSFPELFGPLGKTLEVLKGELSLPGPLRDSISRLYDEIKSIAANCTATRQPVRMRTKRAEPIKQFNPRFEEDGYVQGRDYDPDRARAEKKKLKKQLKKETKGAARELRKDNHFLAEEKLRDKQQSELEREEKYRSAMAFLQQQEGAYKSGQLGGGKRKRK